MSLRPSGIAGLGSGHRSLGGRSSSSRRGRHARYPSYRSRSVQAQHRRRRAAVILALLAVVVVAVAVRAATETVPPATAVATLPASVTVPGTPPVPPWPATGQAAYAIPGVTSGSSPRQTPVQIASVAKVMTAYVVLHDHPLAAGAGGITYTVTAADVADYDARLAQAESVVPVVAGEQLDEQQLLEGLLIPSGNNFADILAELDAGSVQAFVAKMNADAKALGMTSTTYTDPSGFDPSTLSTAGDQARLAVAAMSSPTFATIVAAKTVMLPEAGKVANYDTLVGTDGFTGIKTGSDADAGGCFMFAASRTSGTAKFTVYGAVLGQDVGTDITPMLIGAAQTASQRIADTMATGVRTATVLPAGTAAVRVTAADGRHVDAVTTTPLSQVAWAGTAVALTSHLDSLGTSVRAGQVVATVTAPDGATTPVTAAGAFASPGWTFRLKHIL